MRVGPEQGLLFALAVTEGALAVVSTPEPKPKRKRKVRGPAQEQVEITLPDGTVGTVKLPRRPTKLSQCRGEGICPILRCGANVLIHVVREGLAEVIVTGSGGGGTGTGMTLSSRRDGTRTSNGRMSREEYDRRTDEFADRIVATADALPSTCMWDYVERDDLIPARQPAEDGTGTGARPHMTLEQVAEVFGVTRERIRQIEVKALMKAKASEEAEELDPTFVPAAVLTRKARP